MTLRHLRILAVRSLQGFSADGCSQMAAAISYYVLFSIFPLLIFSVGMLGVFLQSSALQKDLIDFVLDNIPLSDTGRNDVTRAIRDVTGVGSGALGLFGLLVMAWSGSSMFGVVRRSLNIAFDVRVGQPIVRQKLLDLLMVLSLGAFFLVSITATGALRLAQAASASVPVLGDWAESLGFAWTAASFLLPIVISFSAFLLLYWVVPAVRVRPHDVWPGALVAAILFEATKLGFSIYLENFSNFDLIFGSLGAVLTFLFWVYVNASVLLLGAEVAAFYPRVRRGDYDQPELGEPVPLGRKVQRLVRGLFLHEGDGR